MKITMKFEVDDEKNQGVQDFQIYFKGPEFYSSLCEIERLVRSKLKNDDMPVFYEQIFEEILETALDGINRLEN